MVDKRLHRNARLTSQTTFFRTFQCGILQNSLFLIQILHDIL